LRISRLRRKLGDDPERPRRIKSVRGVGYLLSAES
jgi:two-component system OmpR family response regulator/two-component system response regulator RstA